MLPRDGANKKIMPQLTFVGSHSSTLTLTHCKELYYINDQNECSTVTVIQGHFRVCLFVL